VGISREENSPCEQSGFAKCRVIPLISSMRPHWLTIPAALLSLALTACVNSGGGFASNNPTGTGPFDSRGNYVEAWADNPSQWRKGSTQVVEAAPDRPAAEVPVTPPTVTAPVLVSNSAAKPAPSSTTVIHKKPTPRPTQTASSSTKPKTVAKKPVVKAKPKTNRYTVRSGDSLYAIAKRHGTTVGAIQKANGIKGAMIRPGQSLVIPR
jgi:LysM repeat protein